MTAVWWQDKINVISNIKITIMNEKQEILRRTDGGLDVFIHYLTEKCLKKVFSNPYREDNNPSCHLYCNKMSDGTQQYYLKDFGDSSFSGNCFAFVGKIAHVNPNTDFVQILKIIDKELNLGIFERSAVEYRIAAKVKADAKYKKLYLSSALIIPAKNRLKRKYNFGQSMALMKERFKDTT